MAKTTKTDSSKNESYWGKRQESLQRRLMAKGDKFVAYMAGKLEAAKYGIQAQIDAFYGQFAKNNEISYAEATKILTRSERNKYQMTLDEYLEKARTFNYTDKYQKELESASLVYRTTRLQAIQMHMRHIIEGTYNDYVNGMKRTATEVYTDGYYRQIYELQQGIGMGLSFDLVDPKYIDVILSEPWAADDVNFSNRIWGKSKVIKSYMSNELTQGILSGKPKIDMIKDMSAKFDTEISNAERLISTETAYYSAVATGDAYESQGVEIIEFLATLDEKTCPVCGGMDGKRYPRSEYKPGVNAEPLHSRCRCTTIPVVDEEIWGKDTERAARDKNGKYITVPNMTWTEWKERNGINA